MLEPPRPPVIELINIRKAYGPTIANDGVNFQVKKGSVHALLGENGAGKSTTMKLLSGLIQPDSGTILIDGRQVALRSPRDAHTCGIQTAFQELTLIPDLTVLENMMLPKGPTNTLSMLKRSEAARKVSKHFQSVSLDVNCDELAGNLDLATRQKIEIARALYRDPQILLLDEPTSALTGDDVDWLGTIIADAKMRGVTILFISHRMPEVREFCDTLSILRNGQHVKSSPVKDIADEKILELIIGRSVETAFPQRDPVKIDGIKPVLAVRNLSVGNKLHKINFALHPGQIVGIAGLQGMGQKELFNALFGAAPIDKGEMLIDDASVHLRSPADALHPSIAIGMVPEERKTEGLFLTLPGKQNASLPVIDRFCKKFLLNPHEETNATATSFAAVEVDSRAQYLPVSAFSGGNQQKIAIAKWLVAQSRILLLFDPTRGIDVGTKHQLYQLMSSFTAAGGSILLHSTEVPELAHMSDRVGVLYQGKIASWLDGEAITETNIIQATLGANNEQTSGAA
ncbi:sugar ABC transporter ATP-binding protein [Cohaesibacter gelatinilyticus]|uniref:Autoinducer 2 import ATP-binding protein LsrA n=1 Tax=Cohaesibacter gelatinilyticus TaxID=372072 RepID=A0A285PGP3_9HYPH|nr:sugar ABC transporter ATP-binding protein [Cohaesibacter gelatinilyticus]SNZ19316.1 monosaccharide ABC transporter ATP-binding protein, CUT2 family [Cohaesibacter gelatinilyticus]